MNQLTPQTPDCTCDNEAEVFYNMWKLMDALHDRVETGKSSCCSEDDVIIEVKNQTVTITYSNGQVFSYPSP
jgi:hypothetical protein